MPATRDGALWHRRGSPSRWPSHHHDELELNLVMRGSATYLIQGRRAPLERFTLRALFPDQEHILVDESSDCRLWGLVFRPRLVARHARGARQLYRRGDPGIDARWQLAAREAHQLDTLCRTVQALHGDEAINAGLATILLAAWELCEAAGTGEVSEAVHPALLQAVRLLRQDPGQDGSSLARAVGLSRARLSRLFTEGIGVPLSTFRTRQRLARAQDLLQDGRHNLLEAALAAGFGSYAQFHRVVRAQLGVSPRELRGASDPPQAD